MLKCLGMFAPKLLTEFEMNEIQKRLIFQPVNLGDIAALNNRILFLHKKNKDNLYKNEYFTRHLEQVNRLISVFDKSLKNSIITVQGKKSLKSWFENYNLKKHLKNLFARTHPSIKSLPTEQLDLSAVIRLHSQLLDKYLKYREEKIQFPKHFENISDLENLESFSILKKILDLNYQRLSNQKNNPRNEKYIDETIRKETDATYELKNKLIMDSSIKFSVASVMNQMGITADDRRIKIFNEVKEMMNRILMINEYGRTEIKDVGSDLIVKKTAENLRKLLGPKRRLDKFLKTYTVFQTKSDYRLNQKYNQLIRTYPVKLAFTKADLNVFG